jgi:hypothetical protein
MTQFPPPPGPGGAGGPPPQPGWGAPQAPGPQPWQQQQQPQPGYAQQPPKGNSNAALWIILVVLLVGGGVGAFLMLGKDEGGSTGSPEGAVRGFIEAAKDGDCEAAAEFATEEFVGSNCTPEPDDEGISLEGVETVEEEGDNAVVEATMSQAGQEAVYTWEVTRVDGNWQVSGFVGAGAAGEGEGGGGGGGAASGSSDGSDGGDGSASSSDGGDGGGSSAPGGSTPEDAVTRYAEASIAGDCATAAQYATESFAAQGDDFCTPEDASSYITVEDVEVVSDDGDTAVVELTVSADGDTEVATLDVVMDGGWKVDAFSL